MLCPSKDLLSWRSMRQAQHRDVSTGMTVQDTELFRASVQGSPAQLHGHRGGPVQQ